MRILPFVFIVIGSLGVARYFDLVPVGMFRLIGPLLLIALGAALLVRRPRRCRGDRRTRTGGGSASMPLPPGTL